MSSVIMNYYNELKTMGVHADLVANGYIEDDFKKSFELNGDQVFVLKTRSKRPILYIKELRKIAEAKNYEIIYIHGNSGTLVLETEAVKKSSAKIVIHAHGVRTNHPVIHKIFRSRMNRECNYRFAASKEAGKFLFGKRKFIVIPNGIKTEEYTFNKKRRKIVRKALGIGENEKVVVQLGAFTFQKNYNFTLKIIKRMNDVKDLHFILFGEGPDKNKIKNRIIADKIEKKVSVFGATSDVKGVLMAADGVIFPSRYEPFGLVALEAQASGVDVAVSATFIKRLRITSCIRYIPLEVEPWSDWIRALEFNEDRSLELNHLLIKKSGYDIHENAKQMLAFFKNMIGI